MPSGPGIRAGVELITAAIVHFAAGLRRGVTGRRGLLGPRRR
ncbi:MAG: hypothetical protein ACM31K_03520 [Solirubrobacterales bacterium]